jgi:membrane associated rhomboid family serine protease
VNQPVYPPPENLFVCYRHPDRRAGVTCQRCDRPICPDCMTTASVGFHCPECSRSGRQKVYTKADIAQVNRPVLTQAIIGLNALVFLAGFADQDRGFFGGGGAFRDEGGLFGPLVAQGEWYRLVTSGFLHFGLFHLAVNMYMLFLLGSLLEPSFGRARFAAVYSTSLLCGSLGVMILDPNALTAGASGAIYGLLGATIVAFRSRGIDIWSSGIGMTLVINLVITFSIPGISIGGHVGGLLGGLASAWLLIEGSRTLGTRQALGAVVGLGGAAFGLALAIA